ELLGTHGPRLAPEVDADAASFEYVYALHVHDDPGDARAIQHHDGPHPDTLAELRGDQGRRMPCFVLGVLEARFHALPAVVQHAADRAHLQPAIQSLRVDREHSGRTDHDVIDHVPGPGNGPGVQRHIAGCLQHPQATLGERLRRRHADLGGYDRGGLGAQEDVDGDVNDHGGETDPPVERDAEDDQRDKRDERASDPAAQPGVVTQVRVDQLAAGQWAA